jgi:hypothetical protein
MGVSNSVMCDHQCPIYEKCQRYLPSLDRKKDDHIDPMPYKGGKCGFFVELDEDYIVKKVTDFLNPFKN